MTDTAKALGTALDSRISTFTFDYHRWSAHWANNPNIAPCLADYINAVSADYRLVGGDGRVLVVAHSMGGIAVRYAMSPAVAHPVSAATVPYVVTFDTPYLGSPFGGSAIATINEIPTDLAASLRLLGGEDGGRCLSEHHGTERLNPDCGDPPAYFPAGVNLTEMAGDVTVDRTVFGVNLYSLPLGSDGIVADTSSHGYLSSGPEATAPAGQTQVHAKTEACHIGTGALAQALTGLSFSVLSVTDYLTLQDLQAGRFTPDVMTVHLAATVGADCSHTNIIKEGSAITQVAATLRAALSTLTPAPVRLTQQFKPVPAFGGPYDTEGSYLQVSGVPGLDKVNAALQSTVLDDEEANRRSAARYTSPDPSYVGEYGAAPQADATSVSSTVVSTMSSMAFVLPGGNDGGYWLSTTLLVPSARPVGWADLFLDTRQGLTAVAKASKNYFLSSNDPAIDCVRSALTDPLSSDIYLNDLVPTEDNFRHWATTPRGLVVGFDQGQLSYEACGAHKIVIPWATLQPVLSPNGAALVKNLR
jgi:hypothetical protein